MTRSRVSGWVSAEHTRLRTGTKSFWVALRVGVARDEAELVAAKHRARVVLAIDRSSSMAGAPLAAAKRAASAIVEMMCEGEELGVILFDADVTVLQPVARVTSALGASLRAQIAGVEAGLGTALADAAVRALAMAGAGRPWREGHAMLLTDGYPWVGERDPMKIVAMLEKAATHATLSTIGFGDDVDGPLMASMAEIGLGRFLHLGIHDDPTGTLGSEVGVALGAATGRVHVTVQLRDGRVRSYRGLVGDDQPASGMSVYVPPLTTGEPVTLPFHIEHTGGLPEGRSQVGLITLRTFGIDGSPITLELPIEVEASDRLGEPAPDATRARCLGAAGRALREVAARVRDVDELVAMLVEATGKIAGRAAAAGIEKDAALRAAMDVLRLTAADLSANREVSGISAAASALAVEQQYDPNIGSRTGSVLMPLRRVSQARGCDTATLVAFALDGLRAK